MQVVLFILDLTHCFLSFTFNNSLFLLYFFRQLYTTENGQLVKVLWKLAAPTFVPAGFIELVYVISRVAVPIAMRELLLVLEANPNQGVIQEGLPFGIVIFLAAIVAAFCQHREVHLTTKSGIVLRSALISIIYEHCLRLSSAGKAGLTPGEVTNLVATDTQKLFEVTLEGHLLWSCPLFIAIVTVLLWLVMGPELIVGVFVLIGFVPIVKKIISTMLKTRKARAVLADERINIITAMLEGIRVTKLNHYESKALERVGNVRKKEMKLLRKELMMWGWTMVCAVCSPLLATAASFTFYALIRDDHVIAPSSAFTVLLLFSILRFPINLGARLVGKLAQALDSAKRISDFLQRETQSSERGYLENGNSDNINTDDRRPMVRLVKATFDTGSEGPQTEAVSPVNKRMDDGSSTLESGFAVKDVTLRVDKSQLCAIVGRVGSGKSTLVQGVLGELDATPESTVSTHGTIGYASQIPFVLNTTLRTNILFGLDYDKERYQKVIAACCLGQDIQRFPGGDMCQIGERGVTLSGGKLSHFFWKMGNHLHKYSPNIFFCRPKAARKYRQSSLRKR